VVAVDGRVIHFAKTFIFHLASVICSTEAQDIDSEVMIPKCATFFSCSTFSCRDERPLSHALIGTLA
jgi:hypothetical protein